MATRYEQLSEFYDRARKQEIKRQEAACKLANLLVDEVIATLNIPEHLHSGSANAKVAIEVCGLPPDANAAIARNVPLNDAVASSDGETFSFGLLVRIMSQSGFPPHAVLFRVHMLHSLNESFEVRLAGG